MPRARPLRLSAVGAWSYRRPHLVNVSRDAKSARGSCERAAHRRQTAHLKARASKSERRLRYNFGMTSLGADAEAEPAKGAARVDEVAPTETLIAERYQILGEL